MKVNQKKISNRMMEQQLQVREKLFLYVSS